ncbi:MAG TPA: HAD hydrolase-like protein [Sphingomonadaceae bacterium]|nr:HAD hydrolase-like protein [Sphingomonadaceae bacterium]
MSLQGLAQLGWAEREALEAAKGLLLDWDGCVAVNNRVLPAAARLIARHSDRIAVITNNSTHLPEDFARILARNGLEVPEDRIFTAGLEALHHLAANGASRVLMLASPTMRRHALELGIPLVRENPDFVLLMRDARFTYAKLERAANALRDGAQLLVANADRTHPGSGGRLVPETGALLAALLACVGSQASSPLVFGKPGPLLFERACAHLGIPACDAVMIGDNPETDGEGALKLGIRPILVGGQSPLRLDDLLEPLAAE